MKQHSGHYKEKTAATAGQEPLYLLEISHPQLAVPARVVNDNEDLVSNGQNFIACAFRVQFPQETDREMPGAPLQIDNVGRELTQWLDASRGGQGATVRIMQVMRDTPDVLEHDITLDLLQVKQDGAFIAGRLGFENMLEQAALVATFRPDNTPGIF